MKTKTKRVVTQKDARLEELLLEGLESGEGVEVTPEYFAERRRALKARLSQRDDKNG